MILQTFHWTIWLGIIVGLMTVVLAILNTVLSDKQKAKIVNWIVQKVEVEK